MRGAGSGNFFQESSHGKAESRMVLSSFRVPHLIDNRLREIYRIGTHIGDGGQGRSHRLGVKMELRGVVDQVAWPVVMAGLPAELMALQRQLDETQWWPPEQLRTRQLQQLRLLLAHSARTVPFHAERLRAAGIDPDVPLTEEIWSRVPILTRRQMQDAGRRMHADPVPPSHGTLSEAGTSGSTGMPVLIRKTALDHLMWNAIHIREEFWHRENPLGSMARIRGYPSGATPEQIAAMRSVAGLRMPDWGPPTNLLWRTGAIGMVTYLLSAPDQAAFLRDFDPEYLFTLPTNLRLLLAHFRETGTRLPRLRAVWTISEIVDSALRAECREILGCGIISNYSAWETGYIALQCPLHDCYHVQSEVIRIEILDQANNPCSTGQIGRVVATPLHNFAMPLLRYELGDEAEVGDACPCGRGLPILKRVVGRVSDYLTLPSGLKRRVNIAHHALSSIPAIREYQLVQESLERIDLLLVVACPLTAEEEASLRVKLAREVGEEFVYTLHYRDSLPRTADGKRRAFVSNLTHG
jgi:phenylacetate-CoA ligase